MLKRVFRFLLGMAAICIGIPALCVGIFVVTKGYQAYRSVDCPRFVNDPALTIPFDTTPTTIQVWANEVFTSTEGWDYQEWDSEILMVRWFGNGTEHRAFFNNQTNEFDYILHNYWVGEGISGHQLINCFGDPDYYQSYWEPNPHGESLIIEVVYPDKGVIFSSYQIDPIVPVLRSPYEWSNFDKVRHFSPVESRDQIAPFLSQAWSTDPMDEYGWADIALRPWEGWNNIQVVSDEMIAAGSPRAPATATAIAATFLTAPPFPTEADPTSSACQSVISPSLYNLHYGSATAEETRLLLTGLNQHLFGAESDAIESGSRSSDGTTWQVLTWDRHTANFENNLLQYVESRVQGTRITTYLSCLGDPSDAILTLQDTANGELQSLYLFFPQQGIVTGTYLFDAEITAPYEGLPVMMAYQSSPQADSVGLLHATFNFSDETTYEEWEQRLQSWQGFDNLLIKQP